LAARKAAIQTQVEAWKREQRHNAYLLYYIKDHPEFFAWMVHSMAPQPQLLPALALLTEAYCIALRSSLLGMIDRDAATSYDDVHRRLKEAMGDLYDGMLAMRLFPAATFSYVFVAWAATSFSRASNKTPGSQPCVLGQCSDYVRQCGPGQWQLVTSQRLACMWSAENATLCRRMARFVRLVRVLDQLSLPYTVFRESDLTPDLRAWLDRDVEPLDRESMAQAVAREAERVHACQKTLATELAAHPGMARPCVLRTNGSSCRLEMPPLPR